MRKSILAAVSTIALALPTIAVSQSVTVHSDGTSGDYQTLPQAISAVENNPAGPDIITILDEGPHDVFGGVVGDANLNPVTIQGDDALLPARPLLVTAGSAGIGFYMNMPGDMTVRNLILIPHTSGPRSDDGIRFGFAAGATTPINITVDNVLVTSNDGAGQPITTDGVTMNAALPEDPANLHGYSVNGIRINPSNPDLVHSVSITNTTVSAIPGYNGIRLRMSGAEGSDFHIGEGNRISHLQNEANNVAQGGLLIYENHAEQTVRVEGTEANPILIHDNATHGIQALDTDTSNPVTKSFAHIVLANNGGAGFFERDTGDSNDILILQNMTIVDNEGPAILMDPEGNGAIQANNVIAAGNGTAGEDNVIRVETTGTGGATFTDSAIVTAGPYALDGDGFDPASPANVTLSGETLNADPEFISTDPANSDYYRAGSNGYDTAGISGAYGLGSAPTSVDHWILMK